MPKSSQLDAALAAIAQGRSQQVYLVSGDRVLAEPAALRLGEALGQRLGCVAEVHHRPPSLASLLADLRTYGLFAPAKVVVAVETAVLADLEGAAELIAEVRTALPAASSGDELTPREKRAAGLLLQTLQLFGIDPRAGTPEELVEGLPDWVLAGGRGRGRGRRPSRRSQVDDELREQLAQLLAAAVEAGLQGWAESELTDLAEAVQRGLPEGHALVLAESTVASDHPVVATLRGRGTLIETGRVEMDRGGRFKGVEKLAEELERETGVELGEEALSELAARTIHKVESRGGPAEVDAESTARFAAEYRKLATIAGDRPIERSLVESVVTDRGQEDVWQILDAIGAGKPEEALRRVRRLLASAEDPQAARLSFFALLASFCRQLTAVAGLVAEGGLPPNERSYRRFKDRIAPALKETLLGGRPSPLSGVHPFRLHRAYLTAARLPARILTRLPDRVLQTELRLKGESGEPDAALAELVTEVAGAAARGA